MKITIGIPCNRQIKSKTVLSLMELVAFSEYDFHFVIATEGYTISENRNYIVAQALKNGSSHLLFIDDDMVFPKDTLNRLLEHNKEIVGINAHSRCLPLIDTVEPLEGQEIPKQFAKVKAVGGGILLINLSIFDKINRPWFSTIVHPFGWTEMGEDSWFCREAEKSGYDIWCDPTIEIGHIGDFIY